MATPFQALISRLFLTFLVDAICFSVLVFGLLPSPQKLRDGTVIQRTNATGKLFAFEVGPKNKNYVRLQDISKYLRSAVVALEDAKFYEHRGIDFDEILNALQSYQHGGRLRGASTLSQQLVKNLYLTHERSFRRKFYEALITLKIENTLTKNKILEIYLNSIEWGRGLIGIKQASHYYFKKRPKDLTLQESIFLAAIIPNPTRFGRLQEDQLPKQFVRRQMARALQALFELDQISLEQFQEALNHPIELRPEVR